MGLPENPKKVGNPWVTGWNAYMEPRILIKVSLLKRDMITWQYKDQQGGAQISTGWAVKAWPFLDNETEARLQNLTWSQRKQRHCVYRLVLLAACDFEMQNVLFWLSSFQTVRKQMSGWHCAQGGQWVTHREWVASVCLGDFTLFRQALQECPTIRPTGSCSTDPLGRHWLTGKPAVWQILGSLPSYWSVESNSRATHFYMFLLMNGFTPQVQLQALVKSLGNKKDLLYRDCVTVV